MRINVGAETADLLALGFTNLASRNDWLRLATCNGCGRGWYVAIDTVDDDYYFRRLSLAELEDIAQRSEWPTDFDDFVNVWPLDNSENYRARLHWSWKDEPFESL